MSKDSLHEKNREIELHNLLHRRFHEKTVKLSYGGSFPKKLKERNIVYSNEFHINIRKY